MWMGLAGSVLFQGLTTNIFQKLEALTYDQLRAFYTGKIQNRPTAIVIMGNPKTINQKQLKQKYGKIEKLKTDKLFKGGF